MNVVIASVAENRAPYNHEVIYLFRSLAVLGGHASRVTRIAYFIDAISAECAEALADLGVVLKVVSPLTSVCKYANKIQILLDDEPCDVLVVLDTDIVVARDFYGLLKRSPFSALPHDQASIPHKLSAEYHRRSMPATFMASDTKPSRTLSEPNSYYTNVLILDRLVAPNLGAAWLSSIQEAESFLSTTSQHPMNSTLVEQIALAMALTRTETSQIALPLEMNFPTNLAIHERYAPNTVNPYLLHYRHQLSNSGLLELTGYKCPDAAIARVNSVINTHQGIGGIFRHSNPLFDNAEFWNRRYVEDPDRGSGIGSRGIYSAQKKQILTKLLRGNRFQTVLDIGCGDLACLPENLPAGYLGVDISDQVIKSNSRLRNDLRFIVGDFLSHSSTIHEADVVVCFDVLIHQHDRTAYNDFVAMLVSKTKHLGVISAFQSPPRIAYRSEITAYHEPITRTLARTGAIDIQIIETYRDTCVVQFRRK